MHFLFPLFSPPLGSARHVNALPSVRYDFTEISRILAKSMSFHTYRGCRGDLPCLPFFRGGFPARLFLFFGGRFRRGTGRRRPFDRRFGHRRRRGTGFGDIAVHLLLKIHFGRFCFGLLTWSWHRSIHLDSKLLQRVRPLRGWPASPAPDCTINYSFSSYWNGCQPGASCKSLCYPLTWQGKSCTNFSHTLARLPPRVKACVTTWLDEPPARPRSPTQ